MSFSKEGNTAHYEQEHSGDRIEQVESYGGIAGLQQDQIAVEARGRDASDMPKGYYRSKYFLGSYVAILMNFITANGSFALVAPLLTTINEDIGPDANVIWVSLAYLLTLTVFLALVGRLTDIFGRRWFFIIFSLIGTVGTIVGATAQNIPQLIGAFVLIGAAAGAGLSFFWVLSELVPMKHRFIANSLLYILTIWSTGLGAKVSSAFLTTSVGWRGTLYLMTAINGVGTISWALFYFPPTFNQLHREKSLMSFIKNFDYVGFVLFTAGVLLFLMGLSWGGSAYAWKSAHVIATIVVGGVCLIALGFWCKYTSSENSFIPVHLLGDLHFMAVVCIVTTGAMSYYAFAVIWPQAVAVLYPDLSTSNAGWLDTTTSVCFLVGQASGNVLASFFEPKYVLYVAVPGAAALVAAVAANPLDMATTVGLIVPGLLCVGISDGLAITMSTMVIKDQDEIGTAGGLSGAIRSLGGTVASTVYTVILTNRLAQTIPENVPAAAINAGLPSSSVSQLVSALGGTGSISDVPGMNSAIETAAEAAYQVANADAYKTVFLSTLAFSGISVIMLFFVPKLDPRKKGYVSRTLDRKSNKMGAHQDEKIVDEV